MKDDRVYLQHILRCVSGIEEYVSGGRGAFMKSHLIQDGVIRVAGYIEKDIVELLQRAELQAA